MRNLVLGGLLLASVTTGILVSGNSAFAACTPSDTVKCCGGVETSLISCDQSGDTSSGNEEAIKNTGIWGILILTINIMTTGVGVLAIAGFIYGGILYTTSGGSPEQVKKARTVFTNVVIGIITFGAMFTILNFIVPGGVFN